MRLGDHVCQTFVSARPAQKTIFMLADIGTPPVRIPAVTWRLIFPRKGAIRNRWPVSIAAKAAVEPFLDL
jgi:hypothetical protein